VVAPAPTTNGTVPPLAAMPAAGSVPGGLETARLETDLHILITWAEDCVETYDHFGTRMYGASVNIVVLPLASGLYHIRLYCREGVC
jgi:hypothetical protein